ncbi:MAG: antibiotic biosynthesis monooxygenase [Actinobacteria bacterium]|nr:antibiotic biosynthesis monooxygenase [Actinomycetota bacterium]
MVDPGAQIAATPEPPYYAVIFTSLRRDPRPDDGYAETAARMEALARTVPGFLGIESAPDGLGITVCYWRDEAAIAAWKEHVEHAAAQQRGIGEWYEHYAVRVARVEREYGSG